MSQPMGERQSLALFSRRLPRRGVQGDDHLKDAPRILEEEVFAEEQLAVELQESHSTRLMRARLAKPLPSRRWRPSSKKRGPSPKAMPLSERLRKRIEDFGEGLRQRRFEDHAFLGDRMDEAQPIGMEQLTFVVDFAVPPSGEGIPHGGMADVFEVDPDLMGPPCLKGAVQQSRLAF